MKENNKKDKVFKAIIVIFIGIVGFVFYSYNIFAAEYTANVCLDGSLSLSIKCNEGDVISFTCDENCGIKTEKLGYSKIEIGSDKYYSESHKITFDKTGNHELSVFNGNRLIATYNVTVYEAHIWDEGVVKKGQLVERMVH